MKAAQRKKELKKLSALLDVTQALNESQLRTLFQHLDEDSLHLLFEAIHNCIETESNFFDTEQQMTLKEPLSPYKDNLRYIVNPKRSIRKRRENLIKFGSGFPLLAALLVPALTSLLT